MQKERYLLQKQRDHRGVTKHFVFGWTPELAERKDFREVSKKVADAVSKGKEPPVETVVNPNLPKGIVALHVKKEFISKVLNYIDELERGAEVKIAPTPDMPGITMAEDRVEQPEDVSCDSDELREINLLQSKNAIEAFVRERDINVLINRRNTLEEMKEKVIKGICAVHEAKKE